MSSSVISGACAAFAILSACSGSVSETDDPGLSGAAEEIAAESLRVPQVAPPPKSEPPAPLPIVEAFLHNGELTQGGWLRGQAPSGTVEAFLGEQRLVLDDEGRFFAAFDRDAEGEVALRARLNNGREIIDTLVITPRAWNIERVNVARRPGGMSERFWKIRKPELDQINAARAQDADSGGWAQDFIWPVTGRISGRFGSQRIYRGEPGSYHTGIDIAPGAGTPFVAPADGVVTLAAKDPFSLEGHLIIVDHGHGLNSAFLHCQSIDVEVGQVVTQGDRLGTVGSSGRATGPHLHWGLKWRDARLDPLLFTGPMG